MTVLLTASGIRVEFGSLVALCDVSFELSGGQLLGLVGPNGAGKTTLLRVLSGLHAPTRGTAGVMGKPVLGEHEVVRQHIGFAPDTPPAYEELTIDQFLRFIAGAYGMSDQEGEERIDFWLEHLWLTDRRETPVKHLSRGMRQRLMLARTFLPRPHVILLDEPLAGVDPAGRIELRRVLGMLRDQGCAMIVSSHILSDLEEVATHIAIIDHGSFLRWSTTRELHYERDRRRTYRLTTLDENAEVAGIISSMDGVSDLRRDGRTYTFDYHADEPAAADLLKRLVDGNVPVLSFTPVKASLEEAYLRSGVKQVD
jgi:ABC-2 type transport system ATP-binding protein